MITVVLYGRNDNYGYNLHKRAAISFNCIAEVLKDSDEIIFVDYNTPDDFPTFPEAIRDTLTEKARALLRILRVRPRIHERFKSLTHLVALEPIARNIAIRRSNPANRWILSTNTDLIFVPLRDSTLTDVCRDLAPGFYHAPRIELPETLWESMDRQQPRLIVDTVREWGNSLHLNEIVFGSDTILYDGPGDFQLMLRSDLFKYHGFDERMLLGWHVDSNIARRMKLIYGKVGDLGKQVYGYHCDHTRQVTSAHSHTRTENDWRRFVDDVDVPGIVEQADTWGCLDDEIEEIRLDPPPMQIYVQALKDAIGSPLEQPTFARYTGDTYNQVDYDARHVLPFLADLFTASPRNTKLTWFGVRTETLERFSEVWRALGFNQAILIDRDRPFIDQSGLNHLGVRLVEWGEAAAETNVFVFDFGGPASKDADEIERQRHAQQSADMLKALLRVVRVEWDRQKSRQPPRRILALNTINNDLELLIRVFINASFSPFSGRIRHGFVVPPFEGKQDWLPIMTAGSGAQRVGSSLSNIDGRTGILAFGPYRHLEAGTYRVTIHIEASAADRMRRQGEPCVLLEIVGGARVFGVKSLEAADLDGSEREVIFDVPPTLEETFNPVETRLRTLVEISLTLRGLTIEPWSVPETSLDEREAPRSTLRYEEWLPFLYTGPSGRTVKGGIEAQKGRDGCIVYGPYWPLPQGRYFLALQVEGPSQSHLGAVEVTCGGQQVTWNDIKSYSGDFGMPFEITERQAQEAQAIETRVFSTGTATWRLTSLSIRPRSYLTNWLPYLSVGPAGSLDGRYVSLDRGKTGYALFGPYWSLPPGSYVMIVAYEGQGEGKHIGMADVAMGNQMLTSGQLRADRTIFALPFEVPPDLEGQKHSIETRIWKSEESAGHVLSVLVNPMTDLEDWLPHLEVGPAGRLEHGAVTVGDGSRDYFLYGPYWQLPVGRYELNVAVLPDPRTPRDTVVGSIEVYFAPRTLAQCDIRVSDAWSSAAGARPEIVTLPFEITAEEREARLETRINSVGGLGFSIKRVSVVRLPEA